MLLERLAEAELEVDELRPRSTSSSMRRRSDVDVRLPVLELSVELVERRERLRVGRLVLEHAVVRVDRLVEVLELGLVELARSRSGSASSRRIARELALLLVDAEEVRVARRLRGRALERGERVGVLAVGVVDGAELRERLVDPLHLVDEHATELADAA